jgi:hypothetical protein
MWIEAVINVALEIVSPVEPRAGSDEHAAAEPLGPVVPVWGAVVWSEIVVAIRANRFGSDIDSDLSPCGARNAQQSRDQDRKGKEFRMGHEFLLNPEKSNPNAKVAMTERDRNLRKQCANREHTSQLVHSPSDHGPTGCPKTDASSRET